MFNYFFFFLYIHRISDLKLDMTLEITQSVFPANAGIISTTLSVEEHQPLDTSSQFFVGQPVPLLGNSDRNCFFREPLTLIPS